MVFSSACGGSFIFFMTPIVKDMNDKTNSGGALNCLTWTIQTDK